tara:strand:+ start:25 stop:267 length:243 start_codon:yes stop_codon:yes gene_type:complete
MNKEDYKEKFGRLIEENSELRQKILRLEKELASFKVNDGETYIYESPDGETIYRRKFNDHENGRELIKDKNQTDLFPLKS